MPDQQQQQQLRRPYQPEFSGPPRTDYAQLGLTAGLGVVCGTVIAGAVALAAGKKSFYDSMFKARMVVVATTLGFYAAASNYLPPPPLLNTIMGREPTPIPGAPQLSPSPASRTPS
jgi:hypothetical protein